MDGNYVDLTALNNYKDEFTKESKQTASSTLNTVQDSYLAKSSDPIVGKMYTKIESEVQNIEKGSGNIISYWDSYTTDVQGVDKALASDNKATTEINSTAASTYVNQLPDLGTVDTSEIPKSNLGQTLQTLGQGITNILTGNNSSTVGNKSDQDSETNDIITNLVNGLNSLNISGELIDPNVFKNLSLESVLKMGELVNTFMITSDANLPAATQALTEYLQTLGIFSKKAATQLNELVNAYVSEGVNATLEGAAAFSSKFDYETVGNDYISATQVLAEEGVKGAQAGLKAGWSNFDFGPILRTGIDAVGQTVLTAATGSTNVGAYINPYIDVTAATLNQAIPALSEGAKAFVANFNTGRVVDGYIKATINAAKITAEAARIGVKEGIDAVDVNKLASVTGLTFNNIALACGEAYAQLMDTFSDFVSSVNLPPLPGFSGGESGSGSGSNSGSGSGSGIGDIDWEALWQNPDLSVMGKFFEFIGFDKQDWDITLFKDVWDTYDSIVDKMPIASDFNKYLNNIRLDDIPGSGFKNVGEYREAIKKAMVIENANFATVLPEFLFAARNTVQMSIYAPQIMYDKVGITLSNKVNDIIDLKNGMLGHSPLSPFIKTTSGTKNPDDIKVITSIGDSCQSGWGLEDYNARGQYIVANENVKGSAPMLVGEALGAEVNQLHMPGARTTEVLQILNPYSSGQINKWPFPIPFVSDIVGLFNPNESSFAMSNTPFQIITPLLYGFGDSYTNTVMTAMTSQYSSDALVSYREKYIKSIQESDVIVLDIGMNDYWAHPLGWAFQIARDGGAGTTDAMKDVNKDPVGWAVEFLGQIFKAVATHPDKWPLYIAMIVEGIFKWAVDFEINYLLIMSLIYYYNPDAELVIVGGYTAMTDWDFITGMDDNLGQYFIQACVNFHDLWKKLFCILYPGKVRYVDMRRVEVQGSETTLLWPSLDSDMLNPHPTEKGAYQQADLILKAIGADSPYEEQIKGDEGYYTSEEEFFEIPMGHLPRSILEAPAETYFGEAGKELAKIINTPLDAVPHSWKDLANLRGMK